MLKAIFRKLGWISEQAPEIVAIKQPIVVTSPISDAHIPKALPTTSVVTNISVEKDAWEGWYLNSYGTEGDKILVFEAEIIYTDGNQKTTKRRITTKRFGPNPYGKLDDFLVLAFCHLRQENRTFATSRMRQLVNISTGEVAGDISAYLIGLYEASPAGRTVRLLKLLADEIMVLLFVARADGRMSPKEKEALVKFLQQAAPEEEIDIETINAAFSAAPSQAALKRALKAIIEKGQNDTVLSGLDALVAARTKIDDFTDAAATLVKKRLSRGIAPSIKS